MRFLLLLPLMTLAGASSPQITFFDHANPVFTKGGNLAHGDNFKVLMSHRDAAGHAELHIRDTDVFYFTRGSATLVLGGTMVDAKTTEPDEIRGASIRGGEKRQVTAGDVIIIPNGTPHWFSSVPGPFDYFVVKVASKPKPIE